MEPIVRAAYILAGAIFILAGSILFAAAVIGSYDREMALIPAAAIGAIAVRLLWRGTRTVP